MTRVVFSDKNEGPICYAAVPSRGHVMKYTSSPQVYDNNSQLHDDVIKWKHFPRYWPFVRGIPRSPVNSPHNGQWRGALMFSLTWAWIKRLRKQSWGWWFETPSRSLWRHSDEIPGSQPPSLLSLNTTANWGLACRHNVPTINKIL